MNVERYSVRIATSDLMFSAAHFITLGQGACESLHGHNYQVMVEVDGPLDASQCVVDFVVVRKLLQPILGEMDHRVILPASHPQLPITVDEREVVVQFKDRRWVFPRGDCLLLPVSNTTAELLARHIALRLRAALSEKAGSEPDALLVEVHESPGMAGVCRSQ
jgi:6-pyruvoyltetrahydropterin/6-carboxytetrahydropterin synthase